MVPAVASVTTLVLSARPERRAQGDTEKWPLPVSLQTLGGLVVGPAT